MILFGHDEGLPARCDAAPLDPHAELTAILAGLSTYDVQLMGLPRRPFLIHRHSFRISNGKREWKVVAAHQCPPGPHFPGPRCEPIELVVPYAAPDPDQPPF